MNEKELKFSEEIYDGEFFSEPCMQCNYSSGYPQNWWCHRKEEWIEENTNCKTREGLKSLIKMNGGSWRIKKYFLLTKKEKAKYHKGF